MSHKKRACSDEHSAELNCVMITEGEMYWKTGLHGTCGVMKNQGCVRGQHGRSQGQGQKIKT